MIKKNKIADVVTLGDKTSKITGKIYLVKTSNKSTEIKLAKRLSDRYDYNIDMKKFLVDINSKNENHRIHEINNQDELDLKLYFDIDYYEKNNNLGRIDNSLLIRVCGDSEIKKIKKIIKKIKKNQYNVIVQNTKKHYLLSNTIDDNYIKNDCIYICLKPYGNYNVDPIIHD